MGRKLGVPNKITAEVKEKLSNILDEAIDSIDIKTMTKAERLKLIQISIQYSLSWIVFFNYHIFSLWN